MFNKLYLLLVIVVGPVLAFAQTCEYSIRGEVSDASTGFPLVYVNIFVQEQQSGVTTDTSGWFQLTELCAGSYHLTFSHLGCTPQNLHILLERDTTLRIRMDHHATQIEGILVKGQPSTATIQSTQSIVKELIADNLDQNLSTLLENISGVQSLKNGAGIAKPVVHGLYGNRLAILNNGIAQSGQQWGNDHSPEIDPLVANRIRVIKSVSALAYPGANLGSVILVEPGKIDKEPHLHGKASYFFESNGRSHGLNLQMQKYSPELAWKINGTLKKTGDRSAPEYFLRNTGSSERNLALQLEKTFANKWFSELYASSFNTSLGVLRGGHVGNLTDLENAFVREQPFFTEEDFSYRLESPRQEVNHHLLKLATKYFKHENTWFEIIMAGQINTRKEFDVRRSGRSEVPALSLQQYSAYLETKWHQETDKDWKIDIGVQMNAVDNTNNPETGILPLIPDYVSLESGTYFLAHKRHKKWQWEGGLRYDYFHQQAVTITNTTPRTIARLNNNFHNISGSVGTNFALSEQLSLTYNLGYATRNPAINELYSGGLHQGVSGIEEGNPNLQREESIKSTLSLQGKIKQRLSFEALLYHQIIADYIYLQPQRELRLTIRGAFPLFAYQQTNATISGIDLSGQYIISDRFSSRFNYSFIRGRDRSQQLPLINIPSNNIAASLKYEWPPSMKRGNVFFNHSALQLNYKYVFNQGSILEEQDFLLPPPAYGLMGLKYSTDIQLSTFNSRLFIRVDNVLNVSFREYLNRQRYFANDLGRNIVIGISVNI